MGLISKVNQPINTMDMKMKDSKGKMQTRVQRVLSSTNTARIGKEFSLQFNIILIIIEIECSYQDYIWGTYLI